MADTQGALTMLENAPVDDDLGGGGLGALTSALAAPYTTSAEAQTEARGILSRYRDSPASARQSEVLDQMRETAETSRQSLRDARERLLAKPAFDERAKWLNFAAAMSKPTRTGAFAESVGFGAESLAGSLNQQQQAERQREADLLGYEEKLAGIDQRLQGSELQVLGEQMKTESQLAKEALKTLGKSVPKQGKSILALDKAYVKEYVDWMGTGRVSAQKSLSELSAAITLLEGSDSISGPIIGLMPKILRDVVLPESGNAQDLVELTASQSLKDILGGAFARVEGEALLARTFNPRQEEHVNIARAKRLMEMIADASAEKDRQGEYFRTNETLAGYQPPAAFDFDFMMTELDKITEESIAAGAAAGPTVGDEILEAGGIQTQVPVPNPRAINHLRQNPQLLPQFIEKYGEEAAEGILDGQ